MFSTEDSIVTVFCNVDDLWQEITQGQRIRRRGFAPSLSDSEIITMEIVGEFKGIDTDKGIWNYFQDHWLNLFPQIKSRSTFVRRGLETADVAWQRRNAPAFANLWCYKQQLRERFHLQNVRARDLWHLTNRINRKLLAHTLAFWINRYSFNPLRFEQIISN